MPDSEQVLQLLEEAIDSNRTPEEVCVDQPDLLPLVRAKWDEYRRMEGEIEAMFPSPALPRIDGLRPSHRLDELPHIPGYYIEDVLGRGGVGVVYKARHLGLNRLVALKMLLAGAYANRIEIARFLRESRAIAGLPHANLVRVYDVGEYEGRPYYTMEYLEGGSLDVRLANVPQPPSHAVATMIALADAMDCAHRGGIVHRDLKPANILLSADGTPKISDFGLARRVEGEAGLTIGNAAMGTPSYMAPEQALAAPNAADPAVDIYALGAVFYELLTGRPPFRGESPIETKRQLLGEEPAKPSILNSRVPRDLETICLKCLEKEPSNRYKSAGALADDLRRYTRHEPIHARRSNAIDRSKKWVRRHPASAVAAVAGTMLIATLCGVMLWVSAAHAAVERAADSDLREAVQAQLKGDWNAADGAIARANSRLNGGGSPEIRKRLEAARADSVLVAKLEATRSARALSVGGVMGEWQRDGYSAVLHDGGMVDLDEETDVLVKRVRQSPVSEAVIAAMNDWAFDGVHGKPDKRLFKLLAQLNRDANGVPDPAWKMALTNDLDGCKKLVADGAITRRNLPLLLATGQQPSLKDQDVLSLFIGIQKQFPTDFWANYLLGQTYDMKDQFADAVRFYQTANAIRPDVAAVHNNLAGALVRMDRSNEAIDEYRLAVRLDPSADVIYGNLGLALQKAKRYAEAEVEINNAIRIKPMPAYYRFAGENYYNWEHNKESAASYRRAHELEPDTLAGQHALVFALMRLNQVDEAIALWQRLIDAQPTDYGVLDGYPEYCLFNGRIDAYRRARTAALKQFGDSTDPPTCERVSRACLLLADIPSDELAIATAMTERAVAATLKEPSTAYAIYVPYFQFARALAEYRNGRMESTLEFLKGPTSAVLRPAPFILAEMAQYRLGHREEARAALADTIHGYRWDKQNTNDFEGRFLWLYLMLRHEAEALMDLPATQPTTQATTATTEPATTMPTLEGVTP